MAVFSALVAACGSSGGSTNGTVGCGTPGSLNCSTNGEVSCCPKSLPYFCGSPMNLADYGCYSDKSTATAACGYVVFDGKKEGLATHCQ
jgi:hypothetical protein